MSAPFFTRRFFLDTVQTRGQGRGGEFFVGPFKSFWVSATNNQNFSAEIVINTKNNSDRGLPLRLNQCQGFENKVDDACIEVPTAQSGTWIEVTFSQDEILSIGSVAVSIAGEVAINEGNSHLSAKVTATAAGAMLIPADDTRTQVTLQNKGPGSVWVGNLTANELNNADYKNICTEIAPGEPFVWKNPSSLHGKVDGADVHLSRLSEFK